MMRSATAFLPDSMMTFMNLDRSIEPNFGSGRISRLGTSRRRGMGIFLLRFQLAPRSFEGAAKGHQGPSLTRRNQEVRRWSGLLKPHEMAKPSGLVGRESRQAF